MLYKAFMKSIQTVLKMNVHVTKKPLVIVLGATGTGKSKLSIELAQKFSGEVISADSMQVYKGLDITTNKVTEEEQQSVKHHLLGVVDPLESYHIHEFRNSAVDIITKLEKEDKLPVIVGGTHYYIESILYNVLINYEDESKRKVTDENFGVQQNNKSSVRLKNDPDSYSKDMTDSTADLYTELEQIDPERAAQLHPNDRRKIIESLRVYAKSGMKYSDHLRAQKDSTGGNTLGGGLRYPNAVIFWINSDQDVLDKRLDDRVDNMMERGLLKELQDFHTRYNEMRLKGTYEGRTTKKIKLDDDVMPANNYELGIFQSIGFKEFHEYLILPPEQKESKLGQRLLQEGKDKLKQVTRRYARKQLKWIKNRFVRSVDREVPPMFSLDSSDPSLWEQNVLSSAVEVVQSAINSTECSVKPLERDTAVDQQGKFERHHCSVCDRLIIGRLQWREHLKSNKHKKAQLLKKKEEEQELLKEEGLLKGGT